MDKYLRAKSAMPDEWADGGRWSWFRRNRGHNMIAEISTALIDELVNNAADSGNKIVPSGDVVQP